MTPALGVLLPDEKVLWVDVGCEDVVIVDDSAPATMHEESVDAWTNSISDTPPCLPWESVMANNMLVPAVTSAIHEVLSPSGATHELGVPPGMSACGERKFIIMIESC